VKIDNATAKLHCLLVVSACIATSWTATTRAQSPVFALGFEGPTSVHAPAGSDVSFEVFVTLTTSNNPDPVCGAQGWSFGVEVLGGTISQIALAGLIVDTYYERWNPATGVTQVIPHYAQDLGAPDVWVKYAALAWYGPLSDDPGAGHYTGAVSAVVLKFGELQTLQPEGVARVAKIVVSTTVPVRYDCRSVTLKVVDGLRSEVSQPVESVITWHSASNVPQKGQKVIPVCIGVSRLVHTGDANCSGRVDIADAVCTLSHLFGSAGEPCKTACCEAQMDANASKKVDIADAVAILSFLFGGQPLSAPDGTRVVAGQDRCSPYSEEEVTLPCRVTCTAW